MYNNNDILVTLFHLNGGGFMSEKFSKKVVIKQKQV